LHRRVLLIVPGAAAAIAQYANKPQFYNDYDLSVHIDATGKIQPNSLADLVKRENRFAHDATKFPFDVRGWLGYGLPTLAECTSPSWMASWTSGSTPPAPNTSPAGAVDRWDLSPTGVVNTAFSDQAFSPKQDALRVSDDVVLTNVIGFDVKVWEPAANGGAGGYVDLGSNELGTQLPPVHIANQKPAYVAPQNPAMYRFNNGGIAESGLSGTGAAQRVYDSGCFSYANELGNGQATNGLDDSGSGVVDVLSEYVMTTGPYKGLAPGVSPYPVPLRGIQVTIRCFEPDSKQIREVTIEHDFLPK
jgi:hypothetical protein